MRAGAGKEKREKRERGGGRRKERNLHKLVEVFNLLRVNACGTLNQEGRFRKVQGFGGAFKLEFDALNLNEREEDGGGKGGGGGNRGR